MEDKTILTITIFAATLGAMMTLIGVIFIIYCFGYEIKNRKKVYKEAKIVAIVAIILGLLMTAGSLIFISQGNYIILGGVI